MNIHEFFYNLIELNKTLSITIILVLFFRLLIRNLPKKYSYCLWIIVLFRMLCPFTIESIFSIFNIEKVITPIISNVTVNDVILVVTQPEYYKDAVNLQEILYYSDIPGYDFFYNSSLELAFVWLTGIMLLICYALSTYVAVKNDTKTSILFKDNIYQSEYFKSPFVVGYLKPKIIIPYNLDEESKKIIIEHEKVHISRKDHIIRIIFYLGCILYCINPLVWIAYHLFVKDMEMSCDEEVLLKYKENNKIYSNVLLKAATKTQYKLPRPLAFGEKSVKQRIVNVLKWKKPNKTQMIFGLCFCLCSLLAFTTNPTKQKTLSDLLKDYNVDEMVYVEIENIEDEVYNVNDYELKIDTWLHLSKLSQTFDNIQISNSNIQQSNDSIVAIYKIIDKNNNEIILKFDKGYNECQIIKDGEIKAYRIKNTAFSSTYLVGGHYERIYYNASMTREDNPNAHYDLCEISIIEEYREQDFIGKGNRGILEIDTGNNFYYLDCNYLIDKDKITFISKDDDNVIVFNIVKNKEEYQLLFNEAESYVIYNDLLKRLKILVFDEGWL